MNRSNGECGLTARTKPLWDSRKDPRKMPYGESWRSWPDNNGEYDQSFPCDVGSNAWRKAQRRDLRNAYSEKTEVAEATEDRRRKRPYHKSLRRRSGAVLRGSRGAYQRDGH